MKITARAIAKTVFNSIAAAGIEAPKALADSYERTVRITEAARGGPRPDAIADAVFDALDAGRDPGEDPAVQRALAATAIANPGVTAIIDHRAFAAFRQVCLEHADDLIAAWRGPFDEAADQLADVHERVGGLELNDSAGWLQRQNGAELWAQVQRAVARIDVIRAGWSGVGEITGLASNDPWHAVLRVADATWDQWVSLELERKRLSGWDCVVAGLTLSLPSFPEYRDRVATIRAGAQGAEAAQAEAQLAYRTGRRPRVLAT